MQSRVLSRGFEGWKLPPKQPSFPPKKCCDHSGHSLLCLNIINILMHQIASAHIYFQKIRTPLEYSWPSAIRSATRTDFSPKRKILDRTLQRYSQLYVFIYILQAYSHICVKQIVCIIYTLSLFRKFVGHSKPFSSRRLIRWVLAVHLHLIVK